MLCWYVAFSETLKIKPNQKLLINRWKIAIIQHLAIEKLVTLTFIFISFHQFDLI